MALVTEAAAPERVLPFQGIHNFRDYGGYRASGGILRRRLLWRSGQHRDASAADLIEVGALELATVVDLRTGRERRHSPSPRPAYFEATIVCAGEDAASAAPHVAAARNISSPSEAREALRASYAAMPFRPVLISSLRAYFAALAERPGPSLVHCMAGKDRTGLAVALLHRLLGVHDDDVFADFLLTNSAGDVGARIAQGALALRKLYGSALSDEATVTLMSVEAEYLSAAFREIEARHGTVETYARDVLGVSEARRTELESRVLG